ncbi:MAG: biotin--[acetyl-CoA-carboxylase] ligase [Candidatus Marinimicrobia bacterium]|nr:biotin--[acetyl-CoA-carboxylase] ligase [Candidatus Neomarinimicrobiota bacterium]MBL7022957.1 biotin--[acetyl-CoA-carboxylase] ligase [Candidatus Neomarinimicrobiota bacterium]MBL7108775.1 biotin--[acetyl-CoA-carboxylase] ligase [Candidatus Neomarinimicrobiota bacterium]
MFSEHLYYSYLETGILGKNLKYLPKTESTSKIIWDLVSSNNATEGMASITDDQTLGKGRRGNKWFSLPNSSLTFSILLYPNFSIEKLGLISLVAGIGCVEGIIKSTEIKTKLKWPNDIIYQNSKLGGVLAECHKIKNKNVVVLGIGINVNEKLNDFPTYLQHSATSLRHISGKKYKREVILAEIINHLEKSINSESTIIEKWKSYCSHLNTDVKFHYGNRLLNGRFVDLNKQGHALVKINGDIQTFSTGEIQI